jgi:hypothetical protein
MGGQQGHATVYAAPVKTNCNYMQRYCNLGSIIQEKSRK